jgi:NADH-quinone oxidoreductase subunit A
MIISEKLSPQHTIPSPPHSAEYPYSPTPFVVSPLIPRSVPGPSHVPSARIADKEKVSAHECGFNPSEDARNQSDVRPHSVAILFIISDPEVSSPFPRAVTPNQLTIFGLRSMFIPPPIPTTGPVHERKKGAPEREQRNHRAITRIVIQPDSIPIIHRAENESNSFTCDATVLQVRSG